MWYCLFIHILQNENVLFLFSILCFDWLLGVKGLNVVIACLSFRELEIFALIAKQFLMLPVGSGHLSASYPICWQKAPGNILILQ